MKKFYLLIMALVGFATINAQPLNGDCPGTLRADYYQVTLNPPFYKLFITGGPSTAVTGFNPPGAVTLKGLGGVIVPHYTSSGSSTDPIILETDGSATIEWNGTFIQRLEINYWTGDPSNPILHECWYAPIAGGSLPIKLTAFNGKLSTETEATLSWTSSLEENSFQYEVQRSADGKNYVTVGKVKAAGTSLEAVKYTFNDPLPGAGAFFYRLKMVDLDGKVENSKSVYVNSKKGSSVVTKIFPNPFTSEIQLIGATSADLNRPGNVKVFNLSGQMIKFRIVGANAIAIDETAPKGMYFVKVGEITHKLLKN
ncbi:MAG TPA: T9SS type A sorting domain-containing protein [Niastella sp.]|nr:T9SS type A sorting domain-containing protein [Niastella sp.]